MSLIITAYLSSEFPKTAQNMSDWTNYCILSSELTKSANSWFRFFHKQLAVIKV